MAKKMKKSKAAPVKKAANKEMPVGVKILAVLSYIGAAFAAIIGILFLAGSSLANVVFSEVPMLAAVGQTLFIVIGIVMIGLGVLSFFVGRGLWNGQNWARVTTIVLCAIGVFFAVIGLFSGKIFSNLATIIIDGFIVYYLGFTEEVKKAFA